LQVEVGAGGSGHPTSLAQVFVHLPLCPTTVTKRRTEIPRPRFHQRSYPGDEHFKNPFRAEQKINEGMKEAESQSYISNMPCTNQPC